MDVKGLLIKGSIGLAGVGGISYVGYQAISSKSETQEKNNIENKLKKDGYKLITQGSEHFTKILADYKKVTGTNQKLKFGTFNGEKLSTDNKEAKDILWDHCQSAFNNDVSEEILNKTRKWCVEPITVKALLTNQELSILDTTKSDDNTNGKWETKIQNYRVLTEDKKVFKGLDLGTGNTKPSEEHLRKIKEKCDTVGKVISHNAEYEENLKNFKNWCLDKQ